MTRSVRTAVRTAACAALVAAVLGGCTGGSRSTTVSPGPSRTDQGSPTAAPRPAPSPLHVVEHFAEHPGQAPTNVQQSEVVVDERLRGTRTITGLDLAGYRDVTLYLTCTGDVAYQVVLGTAQEPEENVSGGTSCGGGISGSFVVPVPPAQPFTQVTARMPDDATYYLTVYGRPPLQQ